MEVRDKVWRGEGEWELLLAGVESSFKERR